MTARAPDAGGVVQPALVPADRAAGLAGFAQPAPPFRMLVAHLPLGQQRVVQRTRLATGVRPAGHAALEIVVFVVEPAERMAQLVRGNQGGQRIPAGRRRAGTDRGSSTDT